MNFYIIITIRLAQDMYNFETRITKVSYLDFTIQLSYVLVKSELVRFPYLK